MCVFKHFNVLLHFLLDFNDFRRFFGPGTKITEEITPSLDKQPEVLSAARQLGKDLSDRLRQLAAGT